MGTKSKPIERCANCRFFETYLDPDDDRLFSGHCFVDPPRVELDSEDEFVSGRPRVMGEDRACMNFDEAPADKPSNG